MSAFELALIQISLHRDYSRRKEAKGFLKIRASDSYNRFVLRVLDLVQERNLACL